MPHNIQVIKQVLQQELDGINLLYNNTPAILSQVVDLIVNSTGRLIISGMGKSGHIARKIAASFSSTGTAAMYIHPGEASHGDLGMITKQDIVLLMSNSGETQELFDIINYCTHLDIPIVAITSQVTSNLAKAAKYPVIIPYYSEASNVNAPTTSTTMMLAIGDALMVAVHEAKSFTKDSYKIFHPGGKIGKNLLKVVDLMHSGERLPIVNPCSKTSEIILVMTKNFGCAAVINDDQHLVGIITDGDLRRHMDDNILGLTASEIMSTAPKIISSNSLATEALSIMQDNSIKLLLVVDDSKLVGVIEIYDLLRAGLK